MLNTIAHKLVKWLTMAMNLSCQLAALPHDQVLGLDHPNLEEVLHTFSALGLLHVNSRFFG